MGLLLVAVSLGISACTCPPKGRADLDVGIKERGIASWYGHYFHGLVTASGEIFDMEAFTGAHRTLPLGTVVRVTNVLNGMQVRVRINDRGPYVNGRVLDLSLAAARQLGMVEHGIAAVQLEVIGHQGDGLLLPDDRRMLAQWTVAWFGVGHSVILPGSVRPGDQSLIRREAPGARGFRLPPGDVLRSRRARRVADILAAEHRVYAVATLQVP
ncbi:MAG: septal ring lytic transglycosylase RlpA family protein [Nitrospiraceae bacterium]